MLDDIAANEAYISPSFHTAILPFIKVTKTVKITEYKNVVLYKHLFTCLDRVQTHLLSFTRKTEFKYLSIYACSMSGGSQTTVKH